MSDKWYSRPVLFVADVDRSLDFYVKQLGFKEHWRWEQDGTPWITQVDRGGCELILARPESFDSREAFAKNVGKGLMFISLDMKVLHALRSDLEARGMQVKDGGWGYRLMVIADPDGNKLYFPYDEPDGPSKGTLKRLQ